MIKLEIIRTHNIIERNRAKLQQKVLRLQGKLANYLPSFTTAWLTTCGQF